MMAKAPQMCLNSTLRPSTFYHGTSVEAALSIQQKGFDPERSGSNAGALLGKGVYCTTTLEKAMDYAKKNPAGGIIFELRIDLGRCMILKHGDPMMKKWQQNGFDSAWAPAGADNRGLQENCVKDAARIQILRAIAGRTGDLLSLGYIVNNSGKLVPACCRAFVSSGGAKHGPNCEAAAAAAAAEAKRQTRQDAQLARALQRMEDEAAKKDVPVPVVPWMRTLAKPMAAAHRAAQQPARVKAVGEMAKGETEKRGEEREKLKEKEKEEKEFERSIASLEARKSIGSLVLGMSNFATADTIQQECCGALRNLAAKDPGNQVAIADHGGITAVLQALGRHQRHARVQESGCGALCNLAVNADNQVAIADQGGITAVLQALGRHQCHAGVQMQGCGALRNLAVNADNQKVIADLGGIEAVLGAMGRHESHAGVQEQGCWALWNIGWSRPLLQQQIKDGGGEEACKRAMAAPGATPQMQEIGAQLLDELQVRI